MVFLRRLWKIPKLTRSLHEAHNQHPSAEILRQFYFGPKTTIVGPKTGSGPRRWASSAEMSRSGTLPRRRWHHSTTRTRAPDV